jgi:hypothetical protein
MKRAMRMKTKTGLLLVISTFAVAALWTTPAGAEDVAICYEEYNTCMDRANAEPVDWIRDYKIQDCQAYRDMCLSTINCGDNYCDGYENSYYCPADCH